MKPIQYEQLLSKFERIQRERIRDQARIRSKKKEDPSDSLSPNRRFREIKLNDNKQLLSDRQRARSGSIMKAKPLKFKGLTFKKLEVLQKLGAGTFGRVKLVKIRGDSQMFAIKMIPKSHIIHLKQKKKYYPNFNIPSSIVCKSLTSKTSFQDQLYVYMLFQYCAGGELFNRLRKDGRFSNDITMFYTTQILLALSYMHSLNIVYRDLKPQNLLIDREGHIKIADFGFAKKLQKERTYTLCGTPEYLAPQIIHGSRQGYGKSADWWALGVLIYQLLTGHPPFYDLKPVGIYQKILKGIIEFPSFIKLRGKDLIRKLLNPQIKYRLGVQDNGQSIRNHKWFKGVDWALVYNRDIPAPWVPPLKSDADSSWFEQVPQTPKHMCEPISQQEQQLFTDF